MFGKAKLLTVFLEPDNVKLVACEISGGAATRTYAGQITFPPAVLRDAFIADSPKFSAQMKMALSQKAELTEITDVMLVMPPEKTFVRTLEPNEDVESFLRVLPYFKEELILQSHPLGSGKDSPVTHVAFEKKLVEELQQPFLESGKKITGVVASAFSISSKLAMTDDYFLLLGFEKSVGVVVHKTGKISNLEAWPLDVFATRFVEFVHNNNLDNIKKGQVVGNIAADVVTKLTADLGLNFSPSRTDDVYDLIINDSLKKSSSFALPKMDMKNPLGSLPGLSPPDMAGNSSPSVFSKIKTILPLGGAVIVGFILSWVVITALMTQFKQGKIIMPADKNDVVTTPTIAAPTPTPVPKLLPKDVKVRILNGTNVAGEAGKLGNKIVALGYNVLETKNAPTKDFIDTELRVANDIPESMKSSLQNMLLETYESVVIKPLTDDKVKIEIVIGKKK